MAIQWTPELEIHLFNALRQYKPIGFHKHVKMMNVCYYVQKQTGKVISATEIWKHLETLYDLPALDELNEEKSSGEESDDSESEFIEFSLPDDILDKAPEKKSPSPSKDEDPKKRPPRNKSLGATSVKRKLSESSTPAPKRRR